MQDGPAAGSEEIALDLSTDNGLLIDTAARAGCFRGSMPAAQVGQIAPGPYVADLHFSGDGAMVSFYHRTAR